MSLVLNTLTNPGSAAWAELNTLLPSGATAVKYNRFLLGTEEPFTASPQGGFYGTEFQLPANTLANGDVVQLGFQFELTNNSGAPISYELNLTGPNGQAITTITITLADATNQTLIATSVMGRVQGNQITFSGIRFNGNAPVGGYMFAPFTGSYTNPIALQFNYYWNVNTLLASSQLNWISLSVIGQV